jgi:ankyrin repeat protein
MMDTTKNNLLDDLPNQAQLNQQLLEAVTNCNPTAITKLIAEGANPNTTNCIGYSIARYKRPNVITALLAAPGIMVNTKNPDGEPPLIIAINTGQTDTIRLLLAAPGIDVNPTDSSAWGNSALHLAIFQNETNIIAALLAADGIQINQENKVGITALELALDCSDLTVINQLIAAGATKNKRIEARLDRMLSDAIRQSNLPKVINKLIAADATKDERIKSKLGSMLFDAIRQKDLANVQELIKAGLDVNSISYKGKTPLKMAIEYGFTKIMETLIAANANLNVENQQGVTPIIAATALPARPQSAAVVFSCKTKSHLKGKRAEVANQTGPTVPRQLASIPGRSG